MQVKEGETMRPFRFGIAYTGGYDASTWADNARRLEGEGFSTLLVADHYVNLMSCGPLLTAAALVTTKLRIGSYVYNNDFRHPALLAKEAATIDHLSGGRFEFGVGAGWLKLEYDGVGLPFDAPGVRASRFEEGVEVMTRLFKGEPLTFDGQFYHLTPLPDMALAPLQNPLPLMIGGGGPRMIRFAARKADIVAFVPRSLRDGGLDPAEYAVDGMDEKIALLEAAAAEAGRAEDAPERCILNFGVYRSVDDVRDGDDVPREFVATSPYALVGDAEAITDVLIERRERWGISYIVCGEDAIEAMIPVVRKLGQ